MATAQPAIPALNLDALPVILGAGLAKDPPGRIYEAHTMPAQEIDWVTTGKAEGTLNGRPQTMQAGFVYVFAAGDELGVARGRADQGAYVCRWVRFRPSRPPGQAVLLPRVIPVPARLHGDLQRQFGALLETYASAQSGWQIRTEGELLLLISTLVSAAPPRSADAVPQGSLDRRLALSLTFMEHNLARSLKISEIAAAARLSEDYFERLFRRTLGLAPLQYLIKARMQEARRLMASEPGLTLREVSRRSGFTDSKYFARLFRQHYQMTPTEFRAKLSVPWRPVQADVAKP